MNFDCDLFVDTSGWANLFIPQQNHHALALKIYEEVLQRKRRLVTTNYVLAELIALLHSPLRAPRAKALAILEKIKTSPYVEVVHITPELDDAASFIVMQERALPNALTTDQHFEQAGLNRLLK